MYFMSVFEVVSGSWCLSLSLSVYWINGRKLILKLCASVDISYCLKPKCGLCISLSVI